MQTSLFGIAADQNAVEEQDGNTVLAESAEGVALDTPLQDAIFTVIDLETTGLNSRKNAITEITAIQYRNGHEIGKYSTLVRPTETVTEESELITGISQDMVKDSPALVMVLGELCAFVGPSPIIVGHNVSFDIGFLKSKLEETGLSVYENRFTMQKSFCTKRLAQKAVPGLPSYEGIVVATTCGVSNPNPHRAEADVRMSAGILFSIIQRLNKDNTTIKTVQDLLTYQN